MLYNKIADVDGWNTEIDDIIKYMNEFPGKYTVPHKELYDRIIKYGHTLHLYNTDVAYEYTKEGGNFYGFLDEYQMDIFYEEENGWYPDEITHNLK